MTKHKQVIFGTTALNNTKKGMKAVLGATAVSIVSLGSILFAGCEETDHDKQYMVTNSAGEIKYYTNSLGVVTAPPNETIDPNNLPSLKKTAPNSSRSR